MGFETWNSYIGLLEFWGKTKLLLKKKIRILSLKVYFSHVAPVLSCAEYSDSERLEILIQFQTLKLIFLEKRPNLPLSAGLDK